MNITRLSLAGLVAFLCSGMALGCSAPGHTRGGGNWSDAARSVPATRASATADATHHTSESRPTPAWKPAAMLREAALPKGFPPPGPVGEVIVKQYPPYRAAVIDAAVPKGANPDAVAPRDQNRMFWPLFKHIDRNKIPMTAPVELTFPLDPAARDAGPTSMAFLYQSPDVGAAGQDGVVRVRDFDAVTVVSVAIRGDYGAGNFALAIKQIAAYLDANRGWTVAGAPRYLAYNSPFVPGLFKLGEVQVPVRQTRPD